MVPNEVHRLRDNADRDIEENNPQRNSQIEQEWNQPSPVISVQNQTGDPPPRPNSMSLEDFIACGGRRHVRCPLIKLINSPGEK
jgi:hypothetical protein